MRPLIAVLCFFASAFYTAEGINQLLHGGAASGAFGAIGAGCFLLLMHFAIKNGGEDPEEKKEG